MTRWISAISGIRPLDGPISLWYGVSQRFVNQTWSSRLYSNRAKLDTGYSAKVFCSRLVLELMSASRLLSKSSPRDQIWCWSPVRWWLFAVKSVFYNDITLLRLMEGFVHWPSLLLCSCQSAGHTEVTSHKDANIDKIAIIQAEVDDSNPEGVCFFLDGCHTHRFLQDWHTSLQA